LSVSINEKSNIVQEFLSKLNTFTQEAFSGISVIKSYGMAANVNASFVDLSNESKVKNIDLVKVQALFFPLMILLIGLSNVIVIYVGSMRYFSGEIANVGIIVEFIIYVNMLTWPVASVGFITTMVQRAEASQKRINDFLQQKPNIQNKQNAIKKDIKGNIKFDNVTFTYEDTDITALKNISFEVKAGNRLVILGNTGSGKSTILELIGRLYDVTEGQINIDGDPIEDIDLNDLRSNIGYVPQDAFLFSESIKENIKFGKADATDEEIIEAAKSSEVHHNIMDFSKGYDTVLGERGITLSGGQKQRVSIARAIIKDPQVVLFDDCLSAVDTETEEAIMKKFNSISKDKTAIIVSHRVSSARNADDIIVLEDGEILQQGRHEDLINKEGYYKSLYEKQLKAKEN
jgi:ATP-binding cassette subfamily B protein